MQRCNSSSSPERSSDTERKYTETAIDLHALNDTQVNKLMATSTIKDNDCHSTNSSTKSVPSVTSQLIDGTTLDHVQTNILFSNDREHKLSQQQNKAKVSMYTLEEMQQYSTPPVSNDTHGSDVAGDVKNACEDRLAINKSDTLYISNYLDTEIQPNDRKEPLFAKIRDPLLPTKLHSITVATILFSTFQPLPCQILNKWKEHQRNIQKGPGLDIGKRKPRARKTEYYENEKEAFGWRLCKEEA